MSESVFGRFFGGISSAYVDTIPLIPLGQWLLPIGIFLLMTGVYTERSRHIEAFSLYRYGTLSGWWKSHFFRGLAAGTGAGMFLLLAGLLGNLLPGKECILSGKQIAGISTLWLFHCVSMAAIFLLLDLMSVRRWAPGGLLLLEGLTFISGFRKPAFSGGMYGMWGMYVRSSLYTKGEISAAGSMGMEILVMAAAFFVGWIYLKNKNDIIRKDNGQL